MHHFFEGKIVQYRSKLNPGDSTDWGLLSHGHSEYPDTDLVFNGFESDCVTFFDTSEASRLKSRISGYDRWDKVISQVRTSQKVKAIAHDSPGWVGNPGEQRLSGQSVLLQL
jgi:hypothetical protein